MESQNKVKNHKGFLEQYINMKIGCDKNSGKIAGNYNLDSTKFIK